MSGEATLDRSVIEIDLEAVRQNAQVLVRALQGSELWAVVKADGYGHGAADVGRAAVEGGARALCVTTVEEGLSLRRELRGIRILVLGPATGRSIADACDADLELAVADYPVPDGVRVHLKLETGMGRYGLGELAPPPANVVGLMSHLATAASNEDFARRQIERFVEATAAYPQLTRHIANSAAALRLPESRFDAARCGIALYGLSPFGTDPADDGLQPVLRWRSRLAHVKRLEPGESTGYGRSFVAARPTWIGIVPVGYADGFRRDFTGTEVLVDGERRRVVGAVSMDSFAVELDREVPVDTRVTLIGDGLLAEEHARAAGTIGYEIVTLVQSAPTRSRRTAVDG